MTEFELYKMVKQAILATVPCPDGVGDMPCATCMAEMVTWRLIASGHV